MKTIIFDIGGVITKGSFARAFANKVNELTNINSNLIFDSFIKHEEEYLKGRESQEEFFKKIRDELNIPKDIDLSKLFIDSAEVNDEVIEYIKELRKNYRLVVASDNYNELARHLLQNHNLELLFHKFFLSNYLGITKMDKEFFKRIISYHKPEDFIFIDDKEKYIKTAESLGIKSILFINLEQLKTQLSQHLDQEE